LRLLKDRRWFGRGRLSILLQRGNKAVTSLGDGLDIGALVRTIAQHLPQVEDAPGEVSLLDEDAWPHSLQQLFFLDDVSCPLDEDEESLQVLRRESDGLSVAK
jgi:hypothetical protein